MRRLNHSQRYFEFLAVDMPAPLGTWRRSRTGRDHVAYLNFDEVVAKLYQAPKRLGVDHLFCVTNLPLALAGEVDMLTVLDDHEPISICSTYGLLAKLQAPGLSHQRLIANFLAFNLSDLSAHLREPKDCVAYYNKERDIRWIAGPLRFCKKCLSKLPHGSRRDALVALTTAFSGT